MTPKASKKLLPGQPGTKKLLAQYGADLVCVRYRHDVEKSITLKTVELIVDKLPLKQKPPQISDNPYVHIRVDYGEVELGKKVKAAGGRWDRDRKLWILPYKAAIEIGLTERIVPENPSL